MRECIRCGGSRLKDYAPECAHEFPEPWHVTYCKHSHGGAEYTWYAEGDAEDGTTFSRRHPTREGAIAAWHTEYRRRRDEAKSKAELVEQLGKLAADGVAVFPVGTDVRFGTTAGGDSYTVKTQIEGVPYVYVDGKPKPKIEVGSRVRVKAEESKLADFIQRSCGAAILTVERVRTTEPSVRVNGDTWVHSSALELVPDGPKKIQVGSRVRSLCREARVISLYEGCTGIPCAMIKLPESPYEEPRFVRDLELLD